jgi:DNA-3-methyladenine glycosylase I
MAGKKRCPWGADAAMVAYHDKEWGVPLHDDRKLFEFLVLEGMQAGLSWLTILKRRPGFRKAFDQFKVNKVAAYGKRDVRRLLKDKGIIRNRLKIEAAIANAQAFLDVRKEFGTFNEYIWDFVDGRPVQNKWRTLSQLPADTPDSRKISKDLKARGFRFVGPTIVYAHMQATGMVNDHLVDCYRHKEVRKLG